MQSLPKRGFSLDRQADVETATAEAGGNGSMNCGQRAMEAQEGEAALALGARQWFPEERTHAPSRGQSSFFPFSSLSFTLHVALSKRSLSGN